MQRPVLERQASNISQVCSRRIKAPSTGKIRSKWYRLRMWMLRAQLARWYPSRRRRKRTGWRALRRVRTTHTNLRPCQTRPCRTPTRVRWAPRSSRQHTFSRHIAEINQLSHSATSSNYSKVNLNRSSKKRLHICPVRMASSTASILECLRLHLPIARLSSIILWTLRKCSWSRRATRAVGATRPRWTSMQTSIATSTSPTASSSRSRPG